MPDLADRIALAAPGIALRMVDSALGDVERLLRENVIDAALERPLDISDWISCRLLFPSPFAVIAARGHEALARAGIAAGTAIPLDLYCALPHAIRSIDGSMGGDIHEALRKVGAERRVLLALPNFQGIGRAVALGRLIAAVPVQYARAVASDLGLDVYRPPVEVPAPEVQLYWHRRHDRNPSHVWLRGQIIAATDALLSDPVPQAQTRQSTA